MWSFAPARLEHAIELGEGAPLVGKPVEDGVEIDDVEARVRIGAEIVGRPDAEGEVRLRPRAREGDAVRERIEAGDEARGANALGHVVRQEAGSGPDVEDALVRTDA